MVATDCGALRDMVEDGVQGLIVPVGDSDALAAALATLADDPELRTRFGRARRLRPDRACGIDQTAARYEALLVELVGDSAR